MLTEKGIRCELVIYDDEGHTIEKLSNRIDCFTRAAAFLDEVLEALAGYDGRSGALAEWLGNGLQSRVHRFDSGRRLRGLRLEPVGLKRSRPICILE